MEEQSRQTTHEMAFDQQLLQTETARSERRPTSVSTPTIVPADSVHPVLADEVRTRTALSQ
jgi:hypothetical protein